MQWPKMSVACLVSSGFTFNIRPMRDFSFLLGADVG
jgi:hypothetical protein